MCFVLIVIRVLHHHYSYETEEKQTNHPSHANKKQHNDNSE